jgi:hypothetical protein
LRIVAPPHFIVEVIYMGGKRGADDGAVSQIFDFSFSNWNVCDLGPVIDEA